MHGVICTPTSASRAAPTRSTTGRVGITRTGCYRENFTGLAKAILDAVGKVAGA